MTKTLPLNPNRADTMHPNAQAERMFYDGQVVRHNKTAGVYRIVRGPDEVRIEATNAPAYMYRGPAPSRQLWVRPQSEMEDGRFTSRLKKPPYPFCLTPDKCAGKGSCPRDPGCAE